MGSARVVVCSKEVQEASTAMQKVRAIGLLLVAVTVTLPADAAGSISQATATGDQFRWKTVLIITPTDPGHVIPLAAIGRALADRGHSVSLCTTEREGFDAGELAAKAGMSFVSAGKDPLYSQDEVLKHHGDINQYGSNIVRDSLDVARYFSSTAKLFQEQLHKYGDKWDVILVDWALYLVVANYVKNHQWKAGVIAVSANNYDVLTAQPWPLPAHITPYSDDLTFFQRLHTALLRNTFGSFTWRLFAYMQCGDIGWSAPYFPGTVEPLIVLNAIGLEYPRTVLPMVHYVGPVVPKSAQSLPVELQEWLSEKGERSVVYISMGSSVQLSAGMGNAIVDGILETNLSAVWSLRRRNRDCLEGRQELDTNRFYISDWLPQQAVLKSKAIAMTITHGGMGGVSESLNEAIPLIVIPFNKDQPAIAVRVQSSGAGLSLDKDRLTAEGVRRAIESVDSHKYREAADKLRKIFLHAGGVERAADLVEFYCEVGYEHLVPAFAKYQWNWVQYYNVDVYAFVTALIVAFSYLTLKACGCVCRAVCRTKSKTD